jgi:hypothetical protein
MVATHTQTDLKDQIVSKLDSLSIEALVDILDFVEYQRFKQERPAPEQPTPPHKPVKLGGIWAGHDLSEEEIDEVQREIWANFGEGDDEL